MADYQKMYEILYGAVTDAIHVLPDGGENRLARRLLQEALFQAEAVYRTAEKRAEGAQED